MPRNARSETATPARRTAASPAAQFDQWRGDPDFMLSLARGLLVLRTIADASAPKTIGELATRTGLPRATARRCAYTLRELDYLSQDEWGFTAGPRMAALSSAFIDSSPLLVGCRPVLDRLHRSLKQTVSIGVFDEGEAVYVVRSELERRWAVNLRLGARVPAYCSALGRVLLAYKPAPAIERYLEHTAFEAHTEHTVISAEKLRDLLAEVRRLGYAVVDRELDRNLRAVAAPVRNRRGQVIAAINVGANVADVSFKEIRARILPEMLAAAQELSELTP
jgi:IclR family pca regulon transcriptional regulator